MQSKGENCWCSGLKSAERSCTYKSSGLSEDHRAVEEWVGCCFFFFLFLVFPSSCGLDSWADKKGKRRNSSSPALTSSHCLLSFTLNRLSQGPLPLFFWGSSVPINGALVWHPSLLPVRNRGEGRISGEAGLCSALDALHKSLTVLEKGSTSRLEHKEVQ